MLVLLRLVCQIRCCYCWGWFARYVVIVASESLGARCADLIVVSGSLSEVLMCIIVGSESLPDIIMSVLKLLLVLEVCQMH